MKKLARVLQFLGLVLLPIGMLLEVTKDFGHGFGLKEMLLTLVFGFTLFYLGRFIEGYAQPT